MKAIIYKKYGSFNDMSYQDIEKPVPSETEVLVRVHAATINKADLLMLQGKPFPLRFITGLFKPKRKVLGTNISGEITQVGSKHTRFNVGDFVFGELGMKELGGYSEFLTTRGNGLVLKPQNATHEEAAAVPMAALTALQGLRLAKAEKGKTILIYGASGGVGTFFIQLAKFMGLEVTAVCSTRNIQLAKLYEADHVIDYKKDDIFELNRTYDIVIAANGDNSIFKYKKLLKDNGIYVLSGGSGKQMAQVMTLGPFMSNKKKKQFKNFIAKTVKEDLELLRDLLEKKVIRPHIGKTFSLEDTSKAFKYLQKESLLVKQVLKLLVNRLLIFLLIRYDLCICLNY